MVKLRFEVQGAHLLDLDLHTLRVLRLVATVILRDRQEGWTRELDAILDTGSYCSIIPQYLWETCSAQVLRRDLSIGGIAQDREECRIPADIGVVGGVLLDQDGNRTPELTILAFLAHSDDVPFVLGFADVLDRYQLRCDYRTGVAYLDERLLHRGWRRSGR